ncbi:MAG: tetratricopeptide repeat protein, partial [Planctomycetota bacterium]
NTTALIFNAILNQAPIVPVRLNPNVPPELERIINTALEKDRNLRYQGAAELHADLKRLKRDSDSGRTAVSGAFPPAETTGIASPLVGDEAGDERQRTDVMRRARGPTLRRLVGAAVVLALVLAAAFSYYRRAPALTESDYILLADFVNTTGEPVFDGTLKQALAVQLEQSPFLNIVPEQRVSETLRFMGRSPDERMTSRVAREICQRQGVKAMLTGSIQSLGSNYVITLSAEDSRSGDSLAREQVEAAGKEKVLRALGKAASRLRRKLGESLSSLEKFDAPIGKATTSSLDALKAFTLGQAQRAKWDEPESVTFFKRSIELDPNFAMAYGTLGTVYGNLGEIDLSITYKKQAYDRRDRVSEPERLYITAHYYEGVTGETDKAIETYKLWKQTYPRHWTPYNNLSIQYSTIGQYEKAVEEGREAVRLEPNHPFPYFVLAWGYLGLNRFEEAKTICERQIAQGLEDVGGHMTLYAIAFVQGDMAAIRRHAEWATGKPGEGLMLSVRGQAAAFHGKLQEARVLFTQAVQLELRNNFKERAASTTASGALTEAGFGSAPEAREGAAAALAIARGRNAQWIAAQALAVAGDVDQAEALADDLGKRFPTHTLLHAVELPIIRGVIEMQRGNPTGAIELLRTATPYEPGWPAGLAAIYVRGQASLQAGMGPEAAAEFQKIIDHRGVAPVSALYPLAHLGLARAYAITGGQAASGTRDTAKARRFYQDFFALWKDADPDIPILQEAKAEYAKLK